MNAGTPTMGMLKMAVWGSLLEEMLLVTIGDNGHHPGRRIWNVLFGNTKEVHTKIENVRVSSLRSMMKNNKQLLNQKSSLVAKDQHSDEQPFRLRWAEPLADFAVSMTKIQSAQFKKAVRLNRTNEFAGRKKMQITFKQMEIKMLCSENASVRGHYGILRCPAFILPISLCYSFPNLPYNLLAETTQGNCQKSGSLGNTTESPTPLNSSCSDIVILQHWAWPLINKYDSKCYCVDHWRISKRF